jgi:FADH2-dependent halogenase
VKAPVVIIGGGPAGATTGIFLAEAGIESVILEREDFPRFHIGEALTGSAGKLLRRIGLGDALLEQGHTVKSGARVIGANGRNAFEVPAVDLLEDGVRRPTTSWQVRRADFDRLLLDTAIERGARRLKSTAVGVERSSSGAVTGVMVEHEDGTSDVIESSLVVDASGMSCFLHRQGLTSEKERGRYDAQVALYSHLRGADRNPERLEGVDTDNTVLLYASPHHWAWFIPVDDELVSLGIVVPAKTFRARGESPEEFFTREMAELNPALARRTAGADVVRPVEMVANYSYRMRDFTGPGWMCVGDSHRFIDPFFAFGVHLALFEAQMASTTIIAMRDGGGPEALAEYQRRAEDAQNIVQDLVDAFWNEPLAFGYLITRKHRDDLIDIFAGRIYDVTEPSPGLQALRRINAAAAAKAGALAVGR